jgi:hypothetical protein
MGGYEEYWLGSGLAGKYRIGLNIVRTGKIGVKGLLLRYGEYSDEYSPTPSLKPLSWVRIFFEVFVGFIVIGVDGRCAHGGVPSKLCALKRIINVGSICALKIEC